MKDIVITVINWKKHQEYGPSKRSDRPHQQLRWLKLKNAIYRSADMWGLTNTEKWCFIVLLCICSQRDSDTLELDFDWWEFETNIPKKVLLSCVGRLNGTALVYQLVHKTVHPEKRREEKSREEKRGSNETAVSSLDDFSLVSKKEKEIGIQDVVGIYVVAYQTKYNARPMIDGKALGLIKNLLKTVSPETAMDLIQVYLQIDDPWFKKKYHDLVTFTNNLNKISACLQTGKEKPVDAQNWNKFWQEVDGVTPVIRSSN